MALAPFCTSEGRREVAFSRARLSTKVPTKASTTAFALLPGTSDATMPGIMTSSRRRRSSELDDEDIDDSVSGASTPRSQHSSSSKRPRLDTDAESEVCSLKRLSILHKILTFNVQLSDNDILPNSYRAQTRVNGETSHGSFAEEVHKPGAIVRIKVKNFVTYSGAEFKCGPSLNMIIGPNGTGKSTLVCAICLGLGWPPNCLGRAKDLGEFVKNGHREAEIEIELKAGPRQKKQNPIIRRIIKREGNKSSWFINGSSASLKDVQKLARSFHIQIDNLCQFLPQDRVVEFAAMTPIQLLDSTQKAAASEEMSQWHETLKKLGASRKKRLEDKATYDRNLMELQARQNAQRADVDRINERNNLQGRLKGLEKCKPMLQYRSEKKKFDMAKQQRIQAENELLQLEKEVEPSFRDANAKELYRDNVKVAVGHRKALLDRFVRNSDDILKKLEGRKMAMEECDVALHAETKTGKEQDLSINKLKKDIRHWEEQLKNEPNEFNPAEFNERIRKRESERRELGSEAQQLRGAMEDLVNDLRSKSAEVNRIEQDQRALTTKAGKQNQKLRNTSNDTFRAWEWIQNNRNLFKEEVYGPAMVTCSVKDTRIANALETALGKGDFLALTVTNSEDFNTLQRHLSSKEHLNLSDVTIRSARNPLSQYKSPLAVEELRSYGLDGYLVNGLDGPERVLAMLCDAARLHRTAFSIHSHTDAQFERLKESPIQQWTAGNQHYSISRRADLGPSAVSTSVRALRPATYWTDQPVNAEQENELGQSLSSVKEQIQALKQEHREKEASYKEIVAKATVLEEEKRMIQDEKNTLQKARSVFEGIPAKLQSCSEKLKSYENDRNDRQVRKDSLVRKKEKCALERAQFAIDYAIAISNLRKTHNEYHEAELWLIEADSDLAVLQDRNKEVRTLIESRKRSVEELKRETKVLHERAKKLGAIAHRTLQELTEVETEIWEDFKEGDKTMDDLEVEMTSIQQRIELVHAGNPHAIQQYETRAAQIEDLTEKIGRIESNMSDLTSEISSTREKWEPELDKLVSQISEAFSHNFERIGCAGQVGVDKKVDDSGQPDFGQWAIKIQVKFR